MRILHAVEFYPPSVGGAQEVVRQISERLVARGHEVTVATSRLAHRTSLELAGVRIEEFDIAGNQVRGMTGDLERYRRLARREEWDVVMTYAAQQWTTDALLAHLGEIPAASVLAPCGFSGLLDPGYAGYFSELRARLHEYDALVFHSGTYRDIEFAREAGAEDLVVIPNGADEREFAQLPPRGGFRRRHGISPEAPLLLTVGGHTGLKGHAQTIATMRGSREAAGGALALIGNTPTGAGCLATCRARSVLARLRRPGRRVVLADPDRATVLSAYADADLFVFCSAIECSPLVLYEAMAARLPFVSVDVGNAAEIAEWGGGGVVVDTARTPTGMSRARTTDVVDAVDTLLGDDGQRRRLGERGRRAWEERFTWEKVTDHYEGLYRRLVA